MEKTLMHHQKYPSTILSIMISLAVVGISSTAEATEPVPVCGNGDKEEGEECDDGNHKNGDGCDEWCNIEEEEEAVCGNGDKEKGEECDDGNLINDDGCDKWCNIEEDEEAVCGNGDKEKGEECDDGNLVNGDGCDKWCQFERAYCGNKKVEKGEECDDGNHTNGDGCDKWCNIEKDEEPVCGNNKKEKGEECDDGNHKNGDGCDKWCNIEKDEEDECKKDFDHDGVKNCEDLCPYTDNPEKKVPTSGDLKPNHHALRDKDKYFETLDPKSKQEVDSEFTIHDTAGCSCEQILEAKPGNNEGEWKFGCSPGTMKSWINDVADGEAGAIEEDELEDLDPNGTPEMGCNMGDLSGHAPAWAFFGLALAAFGLRRRS
jgi:cysteine-rich repeat protein